MKINDYGNWLMITFGSPNAKTYVIWTKNESLQHDTDLRNKMSSLGYTEVWYNNMKNGRLAEIGPAINLVLL